MENSNDAQRPSWSFLLDHFGTISTIFTAMAASLSMIFLFSYLSVFDAFLIMTIEYGDLLKFLIVGICLLYAIFAAVRFLIDLVVGVRAAAKPSKTSIAITIGIIVLYAILPLLASYLYDRTSLAYEIGRAISILYGSAVVFITIRYYSNTSTSFPSVSNIYNFGAMIALLIVFIGTTCGVYVRDKGSLHSIVIKENEGMTRTIESARLVLFTSHHVILSYSNTILLVPTVNIAEIRATPSYPSTDVLFPTNTLP